MTQLLDLIVDGKLLNVAQRSDNAALWARAHYQAQTAERVELVRHSSAPGPTMGLDRLAQNVLFTAWEPLVSVGKLLKTSSKARPSFSADLHVNSDRTPGEQLEEIIRAADLWRSARRGPFSVWGNQVEITGQAIVDVGEHVQADYLIFQAENSAELESAKGWRARIIVGNPNGWSESQRAWAEAEIIGGRLALIFETYANQGEQWPIEASSQGVPQSSYVLGVGPGFQLADYKPRTPPAAWPLISVYLAEKLSDASWGLLP